MTDALDLSLFGARDLRATANRERRAQRAVAVGDLVRVRRGIFATTEEWTAATPEVQARARIRAVAATRSRRRVVISHESAAIMHGLPIARYWSTTVHLTEPIDSPRRTGRGVIVHRTQLDDDLVDIDGIVVTSLTRTLLDLARTAPTIDALVALDAARDRRNPRVTLDELGAELKLGTGRGRMRAAGIVDASIDESMSPLETISRHAVIVMGFPPPIPQHPVCLPDGRIRYLDLGWPDHRVGLELDGRTKYLEDPLSTIWSEKSREGELAEVGFGLARATWQDLSHLARVDARLRSKGLPRLPRPYPRSVFELP